MAGPCQFSDGKVRFAELPPDEVKPCLDNRLIDRLIVELPESHVKKPAGDAKVMGNVRNGEVLLRIFQNV